MPTHDNTTSRSYASALTPRESAGHPNSTPTPARILEALLFAGGQPLSITRICEIVEGLTADDLAAVMTQLNRTYRRQNRPYSIQSTPAGFVLKLRSRHNGILERMRGARETRLSKVAVEVLSLVAFRQPVTRSHLDELRGHDSGPVLRLLLRLGMVAELPTSEAGSESQFGTTARFLDVFGLDSLADLPQTLELNHI